MKKILFLVVILLQTLVLDAQVAKCLSGKEKSADFLIGLWKGKFKQYSCNITDEYPMEIEIYEVKGKKFKGYFIWKGGQSNMDNKTVLNGEIKRGKVYLYEGGMLEGAEGSLVLDGIYESKLLTCDKMEGFWRLTKPQRVCPTENALTNGGSYTLAKVKEHKVVKKVEERKVNVKYHLSTTSDSVTVRIWDHQQEDGDIVSLKINGTTVLTEHRVTKKYHQIKVALQKGKNKLILHAINLGDIPPNTAAIAIYNNGEKLRQVVLQSTLNTSEAIEIEKE